MTEKRKSMENMMILASRSYQNNLQLANSETNILNEALILGQR